MHKHRRVWLPLHEPAFEANLDELSLQGWEFVAWVSEPVELCDLNGVPVTDQRQALIRQDQG
jgi:hypothetical protein